MLQRPTSPVLESSTTPMGFQERIPCLGVGRSDPGHWMPSTAKKTRRSGRVDWIVYSLIGNAAGLLTAAARVGPKGNTGTKKIGNKWQCPELKDCLKETDKCLNGLSALPPMALGPFLCRVQADKKRGWRLCGRRHAKARKSPMTIRVFTPARVTPRHRSAGRYNGTSSF